MKLFSKIVIALSLILALAMGSVGGYLLYPALSLDEMGEACSECNDECSSECDDYFKQFYSDRIVLVSPVEAEEDFFLILDLSRKQKSAHEFNHYYSGRLFYNGTVGEAYARSVDRGREVKAFDFIDTVSNETFSDMSTRENYELSLDIEGRHIEINLVGLEGDFITRNSPDYMRYVSTGQAEVTIDGDEKTTNAMLSKIYSQDFTQSIFFEGYREVRNTTDYIVVWDEAGSFYLIDSTAVEQQIAQYPAHTWVLHKDADDHMQKTFVADVEFAVEGRVPVWAIGLVEFDNAVINLNLTKVIEFGEVRGLVVGSIEDETGSRSVQGYANHMEPDSGWL